MKNIFKSLLKRKKQKEEGVPNINCKECGMQFESKDNLQIHNKKTHSSIGERKDRS